MTDHAPPRIYLDNAATSWPKPVAVYEAADRYMREIGAAAARSAYSHSAEAEAIVLAARKGVARLLGVRDQNRIVFTLNGTDSLNLAIHGAMASSGGHVVTTDLEHNSVLRPLRYLEERGRIEVTRVACDASGVVDPAKIQAAIRDDTRLVAVIHASNVTGAIQPVEEIGAIVAKHSALFLIDAAQTLGHLPLNVETTKADMIAAPGHKGLLGPLGTGILYLRPGIESQVEPLRQGGTGSASDEDRQPEVLPDRYESGNLNMPGIAGLAAGVDFILARGVENLRAHEQELVGRLLDGLREIRGVTTYGSQTSEERVGVVSLHVEGYDPREVAAALDAGYGVQARAGIQCAPGVHAALGTLQRGGTVRLSIGPMTTPDEIDQAVNALGEIASASLDGV